MDISFRPLRDVDPAELIALHNDARVRRHLPLAASLNFDAETCRAWLAEKDAHWRAHSYGPWSVWIDGVFVGWGGLQHEGKDADLALVLKPEFWGCGKVIACEIIRRVFAEQQLPSITALLPLSRRGQSLLRLGFSADGEVEIAGVRFARYRLARLTVSCYY